MRRTEMDSLLLGGEDDEPSVPDSVLKDLLLEVYRHICTSVMRLCDGVFQYVSRHLLKNLQQMQLHSTSSLFQRQVHSIIITSILVMSYIVEVLYMNAI